jgi:WD40 repeat protein
MNHFAEQFRRRRLTAIILVSLVIVIVGLVILIKIKTLPTNLPITIPLSTSVSPLFDKTDLCFDLPSEHLLILHDGLIDVRNLADGSQATSLQNPGDPLVRLIPDRQGSVGYCLTAKGNIKRLDLQTFRLSNETSLDPSQLRGLSVTSKGELIAVSSVDNTVTLTNLADGRSSFRRKVSNPTFGALSADGEVIAFADHWHSTFQFALISGKNMDEKTHDFGEGTWVESIDFCGQTHVLAVGLKILVGNGGSVSGLLLWDCDSNRELDRLQPLPEIISMTSSENGELLVLGFHYSSILVCSTRPLRIPHEAIGI